MRIRFNLSIAVIIQGGHEVDFRWKMNLKLASLLHIDSLTIFNFIL